MNVTGQFYEGHGEMGIGAEFQIAINESSPYTWVSVADVKTMKPGRLDAAIHDKSHTRSPDRTREKKVGMIDAQPWVFTLNWRPDHGSHNNAGGDGFTSGGLLAMFLAGDERQMRIVRADDAGEIPFRGSVNVYDIGEIGIDNITPLTVEITPLTSFAGDLP